METYGAPTPENPDLYNAVFFTNYSYHYETEKEADRGDEPLFIISQVPKVPLPNFGLLNILINALNHYGNIPNLDLM